MKAPCLIRLRRLQNGAGQRQQEFEFLQNGEHVLDAIGLRLARQHRADELWGVGCDVGGM